MWPFTSHFFCATGLRVYIYLCLLTKVVWHTIAAGTLDTSRLYVMADLRFPSFLGHTFSSFITFFLFCNVTNLSPLLSAMSVIDSRAYYSRFQSSQGQIVLG